MLKTENARLKIVVPATVVIVFILPYFIFGRFDDAAGDIAVRAHGRNLVSVSGGFNLSVATALGFVALACVAAEFGLVMLLYLKHGIHARVS
jgi:Cu(I)/Ag(I) efflux system membrane protein CusA/SilA